METTERKRAPLTEEQQREKIVRSFIKDGRLASIPVKASKREVILAHLASTLFEVERTYTEGEVNGILRAVYEDFCTLRRDLVDSGHLTRSRDGAEYRRP